MFTPSKTFAGPKPGLVFTTVNSKTGYYPDPLLNSNAEPSSKKRRTGSPDTTSTSASTSTSISTSTLKSFKSSLLTLETLTNANLSARSLSSDPSTYIPSETSLYLHLLSLLPLFKSLDPDFFIPTILPTLIGLCTHDNSDIVTPSLELISSTIEFEGTIETLQSNNFADILVSNLPRMSSTELTFTLLDSVPYTTPSPLLYDYCTKNQTGSDALTDFLLSQDPKTVHEIVKDDSLLKWYHTSTDGEDVFQSILTCVRTDWKGVCIECEGIELFVLHLEKNKRGSALIILNNLLEDEKACVRFIKSSGLKVLFKILLNKFKTTRGGDRTKSWRKSELRTAINILWSLAKYLPEGIERERYLSKFIENEFTALERVVEVIVEYDGIGRKCMKKYLVSKEAEADEEDGEDLEGEARRRGIDGGLDTYFYGCEMLAIIMKKDKKIWAAVIEAVKVRGGGVSWIKDGCREMGSEEGEGI
ncbi:hypothetical protein TrST_g12472 [Triparma strigata]|uniref:Beta-catenin-like protein 1 N-terminal domain-containing protein n=1 Tax=Triparma strigata TaxID=1606541 RepID=A0A9W7EKI8_9STRA|nr:hypothetical protein TrST_g12472 [Triparma strigata]